MKMMQRSTRRLAAISLCCVHEPTDVRFPQLSRVSRVSRVTTLLTVLFPVATSCCQEVAQLAMKLSGPVS